jgi:hypothetical protein
MASNDNDIFVIIVLWLLYIGIHVCMDYVERRAQRSAAVSEAEAVLRRPGGILAEVADNAGNRSGHPWREVHVVVVGAETDAATLANTEPCEGALVPDANGNIPQPPSPVHYGEASYAPRVSPYDDSTQHPEAAVPQEGKPLNPSDA